MLEAPVFRTHVEESARGFGRLKSLLATIFTVYANREVSSEPLPENSL